MDRKLIDKKRNIYCDSYGPMYGYHNNESTLYNSFSGLKVKWLYKIVFAEKEEFSGDTTVATKLYEYKNFGVQKPE
ncbi:hypothetical protein [Arachidicoccus sp.]|uniref:hypothetical protein n=1 Tax=Arachidicoccus sp. TaxID=1872624 RepID=UPI003D1F15BB